MSSMDSSSARGSVKTLAIRLELDRHAQLSLIAQLRGNTITDELQKAVEAHIEAIKATPEFAAQADTVLADLEREAAARRDAISTLFGASQPSSDTSGGSGSKSRRKSAGEETPDS